MSKTIKIIDLLNKIANGEEVPKKIKYKNEIYILNKNTETIDDLYRLGHNEGIDWLSHINITLHDIVEIIEEQQDIDIQSIEEMNLSSTPTKYEVILHKLVQAVKQLDNKINNGGK